MLKNIDFILPYAKQLYGINSLYKITMGNSGDAIFEAEIQKSKYILKVSEFNEKKLSHKEFELNWIEYLSNKIDGVVKLIKSKNNKLYEVIEKDNNVYILFLQEKANGKIIDINNPTEFNEQLFFNLGMLMGNIHKLTTKYEVNINCNEFKWNGPHFWRKNIDILDKSIKQAEDILIKELDKLPINKEIYGVVHYDIHTDNFLVENNKITLIDFDNCQLNWYASDVASAVFFMIQKGVGPLKNFTENERTEFAENYLISYLKGYLKTNYISPYWIEKLDLFMKYQMIDEYVASQIMYNKENDPMWKRNLDWHKDRIKNNLPYVFIDYQKVIKSVLN